MKITHWPKGKNGKPSTCRFSLWHIVADTPAGKLCGGFVGEFFEQRITLEGEPEIFLAEEVLPDSYLPAGIKLSPDNYWGRLNYLGICTNCQRKYRVLTAPPPPITQMRLEKQGQGVLF